MNTVSKGSVSDELARSVFRFRKFSVPDKLLPGLNLSEYRMLKAIRIFLTAKPEGMKVSELSRELQVTPGRVTHMINSLEKSGYIERFSRPDDRRVVIIKPTAEGIALTERIEEGIMEKFSELVKFLGEEDSRNLARLLDKTLGFFNGEK